MHVFSAGNDGSSDCSYGAGSGWGNITGGHKQAKNVIAVANLDALSNLASSSSRGPAHDGRIKPDIAAKGTNVYSTVSVNDYDTYSGTSMACPGVSGTLSQLYQAYKELNGGSNPSSALMKAVLLNTADDLGNSGPDYKYGWGEINALRAVKLLENQNYFADSISFTGVNTHNIAVPSGTEQVRVMVYWHDKEASASASIALVNNLDITLVDPTGASYQPWVLDFTPNATNLDLPATRGVNDRDNMEQITIDSPPSGNFILSVEGTSIPYGPQTYYVVYEFISQEITLTYPNGGEGLVPGESEYIRWDAYGNSGSFTLEYSLDNGVSWNMITSSAAASNRFYNWVVPNNFTGNGLIRISRGNQSDISDAPFTILGIPQNFIVDWICPDSIFFSWSSVSGATGYEVSMLGQKYMDSIVISNGNTAFFLNSSGATDSWFSIRAYISPTQKGKRAVAINKQPTNSGCTAPPVAAFIVQNQISCNGVVQFTDQSSNNPNFWLWDFGDGTTSTQQNPLHTYVLQGNYTVSLSVSNSLGADNIIQNNVVVVAFNPGPIAYNDTICADSNSFTLISFSSGDISWFSDTISNNLIGTGNSYTTPMLNVSTAFYLKEQSIPIFGGPVDNNIGSGGYYNNDRHLFIDCYKPSTIVSFDVYAGSANTITFELRDNNSIVIEDTTITVSVGLNTLLVDFDLPIGNNFELGIAAAGHNLYRNSNGATYPYLIGNLAAITGHNSPNSAGYHYFFYNLQLRENCKSEYTEVWAVINNPIPSPLIFQNGNQLSVPYNPSFTYQWFFNSSPIANSDTCLISITQTGNYSVDVSQGNCNTSSQVFNAIISGNEDNNYSVSISPNPMQGKGWISTNHTISSIQILDLCGKVIKEFDNINQSIFYIDMDAFADGIYFVKVMTPFSETKHKLILQKTE